MSSQWPFLDASRYPGIVLCAAWCGLLGVALLAWALAHLASLPLVSLIAAGGFLYAARGLLKGRKPGWHIAAFLAFATLVTRGVAVACTPGEIAAGEASLLDALREVFLLITAWIVFGILRRREVRRLYGVPESYRQ